MGDGEVRVVERRREAWIEALGAWLRQPRRPGAAVARAVAERYSGEAIAREALAGYGAILRGSGP
jgi:hypothetical protein